jgi:hypothetical protein
VGLNTNIQRHAFRAAPISNTVAFKAVTPTPVHTRLVPQGLAPDKERRDCSVHAGYINCRHTDVEPQAMSNENQRHREQVTAESFKKKGLII